MIDKKIKKSFRLKPVQSMFSKKIKYEEGMTGKVLKVALHFGMLSEDEFNAIMALKKDKDISIPDDELMNTLTKLVKKKILVKTH
ncbi:MAG: hypothetical protein EU544_03015 [Promethearchaeota archaeon]|nr:MAG: hypothetical protein EU544_03015 [Candidatus Lokiarchaeota archaeon]